MADSHASEPRTGQTEAPLTYRWQVRRSSVTTNFPKQGCFMVNAAFGEIGPRQAITGNEMRGQGAWGAA
ncbi:MAG: hypothetical protein KUG59_02560 [Parvibaculaceae bacterium]|nr:hypothetical protein [Parvibaculaceae bacterium]